MIGDWGLCEVFGWCVEGDYVVVVRGMRRVGEVFVWYYCEEDKGVW